MGIIAQIVKPVGRDWSNGESISSRFRQVVIENISGPHEPGEDRPAVVLVEGNQPGTVMVVSIENATELVNGEAVPFDFRGPMFGGCYIETSDTRFTEAVEAITKHPFYGAVALHDRFETSEQSRLLAGD